MHASAFIRPAVVKTALTLRFGCGHLVRRASMLRRSIMAAAVAVGLAAVVAAPAAEARDRTGEALVGGVIGLATGLIIAGALNDRPARAHAAPVYGDGYAPYGGHGYAPSSNGYGYARPHGYQPYGYGAVGYAPVPAYRRPAREQCWVERYVNEDGYRVKRRICEVVRY
jgi:hypothetical protein